MKDSFPFYFLSFLNMDCKVVGIIYDVCVAKKMTRAIARKGFNKHGHASKKVLRVRNEIFFIIYLVRSAVA